MGPVLSFALACGSGFVLTPKPAAEDWQNGLPVTVSLWCRVQDKLSELLLERASCVQCGKQEGDACLC